MSLSYVGALADKTVPQKVEREAAATQVGFSLTCRAGSISASLLAWLHGLCPAIPRGRKAVPLPGQPQAVLGLSWVELHPRASNHAR